MNPLIAVQAALPPPSLLPTWRQVMHASRGLLQNTLEQLVELSNNDTEWQVCDSDVDNAVELALDHVRRMSTHQPEDRFDFELEWLKAAATLRLAHAAFGRPDSLFGMRLTAAIHQMEILPELMEFVDESDDA